MRRAEPASAALLLTGLGAAWLRAPRCNSEMTVRSRIRR
ncbi:MAG: PEP-CTERM sorting domain-containing protein [Acidobacteria bacterium]|nr:PEP-CTERM sorting domain-containing protein [Acidobacteriota bacterium]